MRPSIRPLPLVLATALLLIMAGCRPEAGVNDLDGTPAGKPFRSAPPVHGLSMSTTDVAGAMRAAGIPKLTLEQARNACDFPVLELCEEKARAAGGVTAAYVDVEGKTGNPSSGITYANGLRLGTECVAEPLDLDWFLSLEFPVDTPEGTQNQRVYRMAEVNGIQAVGKDSIKQTGLHTLASTSTSASPGLAVVRWQVKNPSGSEWLVYTVAAQESTLGELVGWAEGTVR